MDFRSDIRDIRFVAFEMLKIQELAEHKLYREASRETLDMVLDEGYKFAKEVLAPANEVGDRQGCKFEGGKVSMHSMIKDVLRKWGEQGWSGIVEGPEWGGQGLPLVTASILNEMFTGANCAAALVPMLTVGAAHLIEKYASEELKKTYLEKMYSLQWAGNMCLTEPQAGSDVGASKCRAVKVSDGVYRIMGTKNFITGGDHDGMENIVHILLARIDGAPKGTKGLSVFLIPKYRVNPDGSVGEFNDVCAAGIEHKMGIHGTPTCTMNYGDNERCLGYLIGPENGGMKIMFTLMNEARLWVGMQGLALAAAAYQQALQYSRERVQGSDIADFKNPDAGRVVILRHPDIRRMLMTMRACTEAMRSLFLTVAWMEDIVRITDSPEKREYYQGLVDLLTPVCKAYGSDTGFDMTVLGVQVLGGYGYCKEYPLEQLMRDVKIASIYEGTNGIQAMDLFARKVPGKGGKLFLDYMQSITGFIRENKGKRPCIDDLLQAVGEAQGVLQKLTLKLGNQAKENLALGMLQASAYLKAFGQVASAFELAKQAVTAHDKLQDLYAEKGVSTPEEKAALYRSNAEVNFYKSKIHTARFFMTNILPQVTWVEKSVDAKNLSAMEVRFGLEEEA
jgi:alkylation response protein AidB-like acyl-CoA dehydrogenase